MVASDENLQYEALPQRDSRTRDGRIKTEKLKRQKVEAKHAVAEEAKEDWTIRTAKNEQNEEVEDDTEHVKFEPGRTIVSYYINTTTTTTNNNNNNNNNNNERKQQYEYKDHTADIQIRSWGKSTAIAFAWAALGMFDYMTPLEQLPMEPKVYRRFECSAHDLKSLLFAFLDELLFLFHTEQVICTKIQILEFTRGYDDKTENEECWTIKGIVAGDLFIDGVHEQGTEVKAITYSEMQIHENAKDGSCEVFVIVDI